jgi:hypothetical protein
VSSNVANGNGYYGIFDQGSGNIFKTNTANYNAQDGIFASHTAIVDAAATRPRATTGNPARPSSATGWCVPDRA